MRRAKLPPFVCAYNSKKKVFCSPVSANMSPNLHQSLPSGRTAKNATKKTIWCSVSFFFLWFGLDGGFEYTSIVLKTKPDDTALLGGVQPSSPISKTSSPSSSMTHNSISNCSGETTSTNKYATNHLNDITVSISSQHIHTLANFQNRLNLTNNLSFARTLSLSLLHCNPVCLVCYHSHHVHIILRYSHSTTQPHRCSVKFSTNSFYPTAIVHYFPMTWIRLMHSRKWISSIRSSIIAMKCVKRLRHHQAFYRQTIYQRYAYTHTKALTSHPSVGICIQSVSICCHHLILSTNVEIFPASFRQIKIIHTRSSFVDNLFC